MIAKYILYSITILLYTLFGVLLYSNTTIYTYTYIHMHICTCTYRIHKCIQHTYYAHLLNYINKCIHTTCIYT